MSIPFLHLSWQPNYKSNCSAFDTILNVTKQATRLNVLFTPKTLGMLSAEIQKDCFGCTQWQIENHTNGHFLTLFYWNLQADCDNSAWNCLNIFNWRFYNITINRIPFRNCLTYSTMAVYILQDEKWDNMCFYAGNITFQIGIIIY